MKHPKRSPLYQPRAKKHCSWYAAEWLLIALQQLSQTWFWLGTRNKTLDTILHWQLSPSACDVAVPPQLPERLRKDFIALANAAYDGPESTGRRHRGEALNTTSYLSRALLSTLHSMAQRAGCSVSHLMTSALKSYLWSGRIPGDYETFLRLRRYHPNPCELPPTSGQKNTLSVCHDGIPFQPPAMLLELNDHSRRKQR